jgi:2,3-bisphosphoglycerate-dependent phosphoglycerate mutase|tara:strand:- start:397 stop:1071 length:675 start_codon:yes stop_codon:yes gene_type:complete
LASLILVRHGKSHWNKENRFTGWTDIDLAQEGIAEAESAAQDIKTKQIKIDLAYSSIFSRAYNTAKIILDEMYIKNINIKKDWRINERHYGDLQGLNKEETSKKYGEKQVFKWRRDYFTKPPLLNEARWTNDKSLSIFKNISDKDFPRGESLKDTLLRVEKFCNETLRPQLDNEKNILISAHGNSIRAMIKIFENISDIDIDKVEVETGKPIFYTYSKNKFKRN